jgi:mRNA (2'-O-methyladenosine-N6-)-methyltransferase
MWYAASCAPVVVIEIIPRSSDTGKRAGMDSDLKAFTSTVIHNLFSSGEAVPPLSSLDLLVKVIATKLPYGPSTPASPPFRLTDLRHFEVILESLAHDWEHGEIQLSREGSQAELYIIDVRTGFQSDGGPPDNFELIGSRKRKRVKDEDADSAAGDDQSSLEDNSAALTPLGGLSKDLREVYAILQRGTAQGRLLAEQVVVLALQL